MNENIIDVKEEDIKPVTPDDFEKENCTVEFTDDDFKIDESLLNQETNKKTILNAIKEVSGLKDIPDSEMIQFMDLINRIKTKQKVASYPNLFAELPSSLKNSILVSIGGQYDGSDPRFLDYLAKELIQDVLGSSAFNEIIKEYNDEVNNVNDDLKNGRTLISAQCDVIKDTMTVKYKDLSTKLREEGNIEAAEYYEGLTDSYERAIQFKSIFELIEAKPSFVNRCYKETRFFNRYCRDFADKFCVSNKITTSEGKEIHMPTIKTLMTVYTSLININISEDYAKTICVMIYYALYNNDINIVKEMTEVYYLIDLVSILSRSSKVGDAIEEVYKNIAKLIEKIDTMLQEKESRQKKSKKKK